MLVHAAAGGLGSIVVQWARALGAIVIGTVSSEEKARRRARARLPARDRDRDYNFSSGVLAATGGRGVDLIVDGLGAQGVQSNLASLAVFGHWVSVGRGQRTIATDLAGCADREERDVLPAGAVPLHRRSAAAGRDGRRLWSMLESGKVCATIGARYPFAAAADAHRALESRSTRGSQILIPCLSRDGAVLERNGGQ